MGPNDKSIYWMQNDEWYTINKEKDCFELTEKAPPEAVESFKRYLEQNNLSAEKPIKD